MRAAVFVAVCGLVACDDGTTLPPAPDTITAGPVTIDTRDLRLTVGPLSIAQFVSIGRFSEIDPQRYYDPRATDIDLLAPERAIGLDGDWVVLDDGTRLRLGACPIADCGMLEVDASRVAQAVLVRVALPRDPDEPIYGTGDSPIAPNVAGTIREMQFRVDLDSESSLNETHVPVPLALWPRRGVGMFIADDRPGALDLGATTPDQVTATFTLPARGVFRIYLYTTSRDAPLDLVRRYVALTAKPAVPPRWAFAPQQWRNVWRSSDEVLADAEAMRALQIPGSVMWIDNPWQTGYNTFAIDETRFADPDALIAKLTERGYKVVFWSTPYVGTTPLLAADHAEGNARELFVTDEVGTTIDFPWANGPGALVDFTRDGATAWWRERIDRVTARGAAGFKLDYGEEVVSDISGSVVNMQLAGGDQAVMHRRYAAGYHDAYLGALPPGEGFVITRAGAWGEQATSTAIWPGDLDSDFGVHGEDDNGKRNIGGLPTAISRGLGLSVSGYPFYGSDIGGYNGFPTSEVLIRWAQYAAFGTIMQLGGGGESHNPWDTNVFDFGTQFAYQQSAMLHMQLNPYLWTLALQAGADGTPVTRPARFVYDCECDDTMFLLGDDILVAPVTMAGAQTRMATLPAGRWIERTSGLQVTTDGHTPITFDAPLFTIPYFHRSGSFVPMFARYADTLLPITAPLSTVLSYATPGIGDELRLIYTPDPQLVATTTLHDGTRASADDAVITVVGGSEYRAITVEIDVRNIAAGPLRNPTGVSLDGVPLPITGGVESCVAPGCATIFSGRIDIRVFVEPGQMRTMAVN